MSDDSILYEGSLISRARSANNKGAVVDFADVAGIAATRAGGVEKKDWQIALIFVRYGLTAGSYAIGPRLDSRAEMDR